MTEQEQQILAQIKVVLVDLFELDEEDIVPQARLYEDLDIDSIDAVDLLIDLKKSTDVTVTPEQFSEVRTIQDVIDVFTALSAKK
ncbi:acyl carrier protein [Alteromonas halophila]|uniref:Acyl carrier protein n=1 Tax=Alteromonas halophila TaxID=516698 RepID=A0A918JK91_9ALTE|nr:acyl carrier protein [Alteromonas halophila]GGW84980.1 acyl carrier protein [Alteromonas halophila]